jgi:prepilin signal peptidase PulO-like enzyme (type II secretory pathway)
MLTHTASLAAVAVLCALTSYAAAVDIRSMRIPDRVNFAIFLTGLAASSVLGVVDIVSALAGAIVGGGCLLAVRQAFRRWRGYDGLGLGDVKFVAATGTWTGAEGLSPALLVGCLAALVFVGMSRAWDRNFDPRRPIPFGPFLGLGAVAVAALQLLSGTTVLDVFDRLLSLPA